MAIMQSSSPTADESSIILGVFEFLTSEAGCIYKGQIALSRGDSDIRDPPLEK
jgi:hypothetical protein